MAGKIIDMINPEKLAELGKILKEDKERLEKNVKSMDNMDFGDTPGEDNEEADETEERVNDMATVRTLSQRLNSVNRALDKIEDGTYGQCDDCKEEIPLEVLEANPAANMCTECD